MREGHLFRMAYGVITPLPDMITAPSAPRNIIQLSDDSAISGWLKASRYHRIVGFTILYRRNDGRPNTPTSRTLPHYSHGILALENAVNVPHDSDSDDDRRKTRYVAPLKPAGFAKQAVKAAQRVARWNEYIQQLRKSSVDKGMFEEVVFPGEGPWNYG